MNTSSALSIIDNWYASRVEQNYTQDVSQEIIGAYKEGIKSQDKGLESMLNDGIKELFSVDHQVEVAKSYFSMNYNMLEDLIESGDPQDAPSEDLKVYNQVLSGTKGMLDDFIKGVKILSLNSKGDIDSKLIDKMFLRTFGSSNGFGEYMQDMCDLTQEYCYRGLNAGFFNHESYLGLIAINQFTFDAVPYFSKVIFEDLDSEYK